MARRARSPSTARALAEADAAARGGAAVPMDGGGGGAAASGSAMDDEEAAVSEWLDGRERRFHPSGEASHS